jgi:hypothetical protein
MRTIVNKDNKPKKKKTATFSTCGRLLYQQNQKYNFVSVKINNQELTKIQFIKLSVSSKSILRGSYLKHTNTSTSMHIKKNDLPSGLRLSARLTTGALSPGAHSSWGLVANCPSGRG